MIRSTAFAGLLLLAACRSAEQQARHLASLVEVGALAEDVELRLGAPAWRSPPSEGEYPPPEPGTAWRWTCRVRSTGCWKIGWWFRLCTPLLCVSALADLFDYGGEWLLAVDFGEDRRVLRVFVWRPPQL